MASSMVVLGVTAVLLGALPPSAAVADDWNQWRGPHRDGEAEELVVPDPWPDAPRRIWQVTVGEGHSSPVVGDGGVFVHTRIGKEEVVRRTDPASGADVWRVAYPVEYSVNPAARDHGKGPKSTPVVSGGRLYTLSITGVLSCWQTGNGTLLWRRDFARRFKRTSPLFGTAASPLVHDGKVIAAVGGNDDGGLLALDVDTGEEIWAWAGDGPGYASPVVATFEGVAQVVTQSQKEIIAVALDDGRLLWSRSFETPYVQNIVTPLVHGETLVLAGLENPTFKARPAKGEGGWRLQDVWSQPSLDMYMSSPVLAGGRLCGHSPKSRGTFFCLDPDTGKVAWRSDGNQGDQALALSAGGRVWWLTSAGELVVAPATGDEFAPEARYTLGDSPTWAHPAVLDGDLLIKDADSLARWSLRPAPATAAGER